MHLSWIIFYGCHCNAVSSNHIEFALGRYCPFMILSSRKQANNMSALTFISFTLAHSQLPKMLHEHPVSIGTFSIILDVEVCIVPQLASLSISRAHTRNFTFYDSWYVNLCYLDTVKPAWDVEESEMGELSSCGTPLWWDDQGVKSR